MPVLLWRKGDVEPNKNGFTRKDGYNLRNSTGNDRMNVSALLNIHRKFTRTVEAILNELAKKPRRLDKSLMK